MFDCNWAFMDATMLRLSVCGCSEKLLMLTSVWKVAQSYVVFLLIRYLVLYAMCLYTTLSFKHLNTVMFNTDMNTSQLHHCLVLSF